MNKSRLSMLYHCLYYTHPLHYWSKGLETVRKLGLTLLVWHGIGAA